VRADYCRKNQEASCYRHLFTLDSAKVATTSQNNIGMARSPCLAGKWSKWDRWTVLGNGTAFRCGAFEAARSAVH
jgi:hypothetical protein